MRDCAGRWSGRCRLRRQRHGVLSSRAHSVDVLEARCLAEGREGALELLECLGLEGDATTFWASVKDNLLNGRIRMIFVADIIPRELKLVVEFLNRQMERAEVLASRSGSTREVT